jgi:hypothetical protein
MGEKSASLDTGSQFDRQILRQTRPPEILQRLFDILQSASLTSIRIKYLYTLAMHVSHYLLNFSVHASKIFLSLSEQ